MIDAASGSRRPPLECLPGVDPSWSRFVLAHDADGIERRWHVLDNLDVAAATHPGPGAPVAGRDGVPAHAGTMLLVHGNPTWSYLWRRFLATAPPGWRVVAVDQLGMGYSEDPAGTLSAPRTLAQRIEDLSRLTDRLDLLGPIVAVGHDWGGIVVSGWAARRHREVAGPGGLGGLVLANTAVHHDFSAGLPGLLRLARNPAVIARACVDTPAFIAGTLATSSPRPPRAVRLAYHAPYATAADRSFVGQFVADIPAEPDHPSRATFEAVAAGLAELRDVPALLLRGPRDPVFSEAHLRDLAARLPHADVHRYEGASHLVVEDVPRAAADVWAWVAARVTPREPSLVGDGSRIAPGEPSHEVTARGEGDAAPPRPEPTAAVGTAQEPWRALREIAASDPGAPCVTEVSSGRRMTYGQLEGEILAVALGLRALGVRAGDRVALLVPPGIDLTVAVYACWRLGAVIVVADAGLGLPSMGRALRGAGPAYVLGIAKGLAAAAALRLPGRRVLVGPDAPGPARRALRADATLAELAERGRAAAGGLLRDDLGPLVNPEAGADPDPDAAVLFTSGATGPSKGVVYRRSQLRAQIGHVGAIYGLSRGDALVAAFAPFALYGPALGIGAVVPDMDVTAPASLSAGALADAVGAAAATTVFASPAALRNVLATAPDLTAAQRAACARVRVVMSAGAPVPTEVLRALTNVFPAAAMHTPYGMTECLPVTDIDLAGIDAAGPGDGVCVGAPLPGVEVRVAPLPADVDGPDGELVAEPGVTGEICVRAAHVKDRYDRLWVTEHAAADRPPGWHRTGDVGHLDADGRLWVEGRRVHVIDTPAGPVTPVGIERRAESVAGVAAAAAVGVGPRGAHQVVVVLRLDDGGRPPRRVRGRPVLAPPALSRAVREAAGRPIAAVLVTPRMPVDIRHESKIDRTAVAAWALKVLSGARAGRP